MLDNQVLLSTAFEHSAFTLNTLMTVCIIILQTVFYLFNIIESLIKLIDHFLYSCVLNV